MRTLLYPPPPNTHNWATSPGVALWGARSVPRARKPCAFVRPEPRPGWYPLNHSVGHQKQPLLSESSAVPLIFFKATRETEPYKCFKQSSEVEAKFLLFPPLWQAAAPSHKQAEVGRGEKAPGSGSPRAEHSVFQPPPACVHPAPRLGAPVLLCSSVHSPISERSGRAGTLSPVCRRES